MEKRILLSHAYPATPETAWYPYLKAEAEKTGLQVSIPSLPAPNLRAWQETIRPIAVENPANTILIGHSIGCINLLRFLEDYQGEEAFPLLLLVAPPAFDLGYEALKEFFEAPFRYEAYQRNVKKIVVILSPSDSVLAPDPLKHGMSYVEKAGAKLIVLPQGGHFAPFDGVTELKEAIEEINLIQPTYATL